ncbi:MAG: translation elongation factor Ts [Candidatus Moranbacteria bacterium]|nr:translation elongation factor Ts [Candidatus Moranbacteria bacterium]NTW75383.1 translation elongation factor Ts [Candidatus Moranbacteria bacterium]
MISMELIKALRERTGAGIVEVKKALEEADGDEEKAIRILRERGAAKAVKKTDREAKEGVIAIYLHSNGRVSAMVKLFCETDFVARNEDFQSLGRDIAMHVAAMNPSVLRPEDVSEETVVSERKMWIEELRKAGKPEEMIEKILEGKERKLREEMALLTQSFVKDPDRTVADLLSESVQKIGENIQVGDFVRYEI